MSFRVFLVPMFFLLSVFWNVLIFLSCFLFFVFYLFASVSNVLWIILIFVFVAVVSDRYVFGRLWLHYVVFLTCFDSWYVLIVLFFFRCFRIFQFSLRFSVFPEWLFLCFVLLVDVVEISVFFDVQIFLGASDVFRFASNVSVFSNSFMTSGWFLCFFSESCCFVFGFFDSIQFLTTFT